MALEIAQPVLGCFGLLMSLMLDRLTLAQAASAEHGVEILKI